MNMRIAACQLMDHQDRLGESLNQIAYYVAEADRKGVDVVCFPEGYYKGYTRDNQIAERRAIALDSSAFKTLLAKLSLYKTTIILGMIERIAGGQSCDPSR